MQIVDIKYEDKKTWNKYKNPIYVVLERTNIETGESNGIEHWKFQDGTKCFNQTIWLFKNGDMTGTKFKTSYHGIYTTEKEMLEHFNIMKDLGYKICNQFKEDKNITQILTRVTVDLKNKLDKYCVATGKSQKDVIVCAIEQYLKNKNDIINEIQKLQELLKD